jgi:hypothetical protein
LSVAVVCLLLFLLLVMGRSLVLSLCGGSCSVGLTQQLILMTTKCRRGSTLMLDFDPSSDGDNVSSEGDDF